MHKQKKLFRIKGGSFEHGQAISHECLTDIVIKIFLKHFIVPKKEEKELSVK